MKLSAQWILVFLLSGCAQISAPPSIEELIKTRPPTFDGQAAKTYIVPGNTNLISGECDRISYAIEYSNDNQNWTEYSGACLSGNFAITVISNPRKTLYVRAKTKTGYTSTAIATVKMAMPPTSSEVAAVISSRTDQDGEAGALNAMQPTFTGDSSQAGAVRAHFNVTGSTYGD